MPKTDNVKSVVLCAAIALGNVAQDAAGQELAPLVLSEQEIDTSTRDTLRGVLRSTASEIGLVADRLGVARTALVTCMNDVVDADGVVDEFGADQCRTTEFIASQKEMIVISDVLAATETSLRQTAEDYGAHAAEVEERIEGYIAELAALEAEQAELMEAGRTILEFQSEGNGLDPAQRREAIRVAHLHKRHESRKSAIGQIVEYNLSEKRLYEVTRANISAAADVMAGESMAFGTQAQIANDWIEIAQARANQRGSVALVEAARADWSGVSVGLEKLEEALLALEEERPDIAFSDDGSDAATVGWDLAGTDPVLSAFLSAIAADDKELN